MTLRIGTVVVLAAGLGTRMKSSLPKVLHQVCGLPLVTHVVRAAEELEPDRIVVVLGHGSEVVTAVLPFSRPPPTWAKSRSWSFRETPP
jgi:bifunctional UDP-N-acetylglucosamine pyrophosphorylase/glucosamine-1-phosphate N-acetyltransferase